VRRWFLVAGGILAALVAAVLGVNRSAWTATALRPMAARAGEQMVTVALDSSAIWSFEAIKETARVVVGPYEPPPGRLREDMEADHWAELRSVLRRHGSSSTRRT
jgi:hypothetical protein